MRRGKAPTGTDRFGSGGAQSLHLRWIARTAKAELVHAARAAEEAMRHAVEQGGAFDLEAYHLSLPDCG
ncbi:hypothetical protein GCM10009076_10380 [Erythrobacter ramosus]